MNIHIACIKLISAYSFLTPPMSPQTPPRARSGFSLVEILAVLAIMSLAASIAVPAVASLGKSTRTAKNVSELSSVLDQARTFAISEATYTWVGLRESVAEDGPGVEIIVIRAADAPDWDTVWTTPSETTLEPGGAASQVGPLFRLRHSSLVSDPEALRATYGDRLGSAFPPSSEGLRFKLVSGGKERVFDRLMLFTPRGEARVNPSAGGLICLGIKASAAGATEPAGVVTVNILTGQNTVLQL